VLNGGDCHFGAYDRALVAQAGFGGHAWGCMADQYNGGATYYYHRFGTPCSAYGTTEIGGYCYNAGVVYAGTPSYSTTYSCPSGGSLSGSTCIRPAYWAGWNRSIS